MTESLHGTTRVGVDIGGTFTDGVAYDPIGGTVAIEKTLTTTEDLSTAFLEVFDGLVDQFDIRADQVAEIMHASTVATNALLERKGARVALLVTEGFRDILEIGRQVRSRLYDFFVRKPEPLVPRALVYEIRERMAYTGEPTKELDLESVESALADLESKAVESVAICFLHSYRNPAHELAAASRIQTLSPDLTVSVSSQIAPEIKEYWRASTTAVNAYVGPVVRRYLDRIEGELSDRGFTNRVGIMHSGGGIESIGSIKERPYQMIESGPAAGIAGAAHFARRLGFSDAISFDMGGTTAKAGLILGGATQVLPEFEVAAEEGSGSSVAKASGFPILGEVVDLVEVGAGGGSLAWLDDGGHLRVGPHGAGSNPGPACYGRGGTQATITDANLLLGRLDTNNFLGGRLKLHREAANRAVAVVADELGISTVEVAHGILSIANARMMGALRLVSIERGHDPRQLCLVAFGGAGPLHAAAMSDALGVPDILIPPNPGVASAWGLLLSDVKHDVRQTVMAALTVDNLDDIRSAFARLEDRVEQDLVHERKELTEFAFNPYLEARYEGQASRLRIRWQDGMDGSRILSNLESQFHAAHEREFGYHVPDEPIQLLTAGISAVAGEDRLPTPRPDSAAGGSAGPKTHRDVFLFPDFEPLNVPVYDRHQIPFGREIQGPALLEEFDSTTLVPPHYSFTVEDLGVIHLRRAN
jgi:N-methylhydantoinase A